MVLAKTKSTTWLPKKFAEFMKVAIRRAKGNYAKNSKRNVTRDHAEAGTKAATTESHDDVYKMT